MGGLLILKVQKHMKINLLYDMGMPGFVYLEQK